MLALRLLLIFGHRCNRSAADGCDVLLFINLNAHCHVNIASIFKDRADTSLERERRSHEIVREGENLVDFVAIVPVLVQEVLDLVDQVVEGVTRGVADAFFSLGIATVHCELDCLADLTGVRRRGQMRVNTELLWACYFFNHDFSRKIIQI